MNQNDNKTKAPFDLSAIPQKPGCYLFYDKGGEIIYIGKASNLRSRVSSYWRESANHTPAKFSMVRKVVKVGIVETGSEVEALLLESNLIKKHQPEYNVVMRDDKRYVYIKLSTEEDFPRVFMARQIDKTGRYFGPFTSVEAVRETLKVVRKVWPFRSCSTLPAKSCLYYRIGKCPGVCEGRMSKEDYGKVIKEISLFLDGKIDKITEEYRKESGILQKKFEKLKKRRETFALSLQGRNPDSKPTKKERTEADQILSEMDAIKLEQDKIMFRMDNVKRVLAHANIIGLSEKYAADVIELAKILGLPKVPQRIEGYDISNTFGRGAVGSMVVFNNGEPEKGEYRKFRIKTDAEGDIAMLEEVLSRRAARMKGAKQSWPEPDLIIIDGGKAQLNVALKVLKTNDLDIPVLSVSKGEGLRSAKAPDKIFFPEQDKPLELPLASPALHIIKRVRDEAHRFAIGYHREVRRKKMFDS